MSTKGNDSCRPKWLNDLILENNRVNPFSRNELDARLFWYQFGNEMRHIQALVNYVDRIKPPIGLTLRYIEIISTHLEIIKDSLFVSYGIILDTNPKSTECVARCSQTNLISFGFWAMDNQKEIESIINIASAWTNNFLGIDKEYRFDDILHHLNTTKTQEDRISYLQEFDKLEFQRAYAYAPYQCNQSDLQLANQRLVVFDDTMHSIYSLIYLVMRTPIVIMENFDKLIQAFRECERGEKMISGWRCDLDLNRKDLLLKLKEKKDLLPWVDKVCMLYEGKIEKKELFVDLTNPEPQRNPEINKTYSWICIFTIYAILIEHDANQKKVLELTPYFYNDEDFARKFLKQIQGLEPMMITSLVKKLVDKDKFPVSLKSKSFYDVLKKLGLYTKSYQNWNDQV